MKIVIGIGDRQLFERVVAELPGDYPFEVRQGGSAATSAGCDATIMMFPLAAERYAGADVTSRRAQILLNDRGDGVPPVVVALPTMKPDPDAEFPVPDERYRRWVEWAIGQALEVLGEAIGPLDALAVHLHLEGAAMDRRPRIVLDVIRDLCG